MSSESPQSLFVGVVSHEGSRFSFNQSPHGLGGALGNVWQDLGFGRSTVQVNTKNLWSTQNVIRSPQRHDVQATLRAELQQEKHWAQFLGTLNQRTRARLLLRRLSQIYKRVNSPSTDLVTRLLNIELSHLDLIKNALEYGSDWVLILEDDAHCADIQDLARSIRVIQLTSDPPAFVNLTQSHSLGALGIEHLLSPVSQLGWETPTTQTVLSAKKPFTNTVCAILYQREFLQALVTTLESLPVYPVLPIDWKLNVALMQLFNSGVIKENDCWTLDPGPIVQLSMQPVSYVKEVQGNS